MNTAIYIYNKWTGVKIILVPFFLCAGGGVLSIFCLYKLIRIVLLPITTADDIVFDRKDDFLFYETRLGKRVFKYNRRILVNIYSAGLLIGAALILTGLFLGFSQFEGDFWLFKVTENEEREYDQINAAGKYEGKDGQEYTYYIFVEGNTYRFLDSSYEQFDELLAELDKIPRTNTVVLFDDYATSAAYHMVKDSLRKRGLSIYEEKN